MLTQHDYITVVGAEVLGKKAIYECPPCQSSEARKVTKTKDNNGAFFKSAKCRCGQLSLFANPDGSYLHA